MSERFWQVTALLLGMGAVGGAVGTVANKQALAESQRQLTELKNSRAPQDTVHKIIVQEPCPYETLPVTNENTVCRGGVLLRKTAEGWESVTNGNKAVGCLQGR